MALLPILIRSKAGIKRDGTPFDSDYYIDGQWVRFQRGLPRKMGGYITINRFGTDISRGMISFAQNDRTYIFTAGASKVETTSMDLNGNTTEIIDRTPANTNSGVNNQGIGLPVASIVFPSLIDISAALPVGTYFYFGNDLINAYQVVKYNGLDMQFAPPLVNAIASGTRFNFFITTLPPNPLYSWKFDILVDTSNVPPVNKIIAQVAPNNQYIANTVGGQVFIGALTQSDPLVEFTSNLTKNYVSATGGITVLFPYLVVYGNDGSIGWSAPGNPTLFDSYTTANYAAGFATTSDMDIGAKQFTTAGDTTGVLSAGTLVSFDSGGNQTFYTVLNSYFNRLSPGATTTTLTKAVTVAYGSGAPLTLQTQVLTGAGSARVANQKIIAGLPLRGGGGSSPAGIFWSLDAVVRMTFVGGDLVFQFDTISPNSSILSSKSVIEHDGIYYWAASDRFLLFNGVVRELPNDLNLNYFFDNINRDYASRVYAFKIPRFSEIWWCFPFGSATECTHAVIYNIRENTWYDTQLPGGGRSAAEFMATFGRPLMAGVDPYQLPVPYGQAKPPVTYRIWQHETGYDIVDITNVFAIDSYFETASFALPAQGQGKLKALRVAIVEPDFLQKGEMSLIITGQANARATTVISQIKKFAAGAIVPADQVIFFKEQRRLLRFRFESNVLGGDYQMGKVVAHVEETDATYLGGTQ